MSSSRDEFFREVQQSLHDNTLIAVSLTNRARPADDLPRKQSVRPVLIRGEPVFQWELQTGKQQTHLNLNAAETLHRLQELLGPEYRDAGLFTATSDLLASSSAQGLRIRRQPPSRKPPSVLTHNRQKEYLIPDGVPCPFLIALDVMTPSGQVKQQRQKKFRQINRYLEMIEDIYDQLPSTGTLRVIDFGCGLSYLTFALHDLLTVRHQRDVLLLGIDQNPHVIDRCREIAQTCHLQGLEFSSRQIDSRAASTPVDLAVSLHACDTATDHALAFAVSAGARVILAAPCCQHELSTQIDAPALSPLLKHGILKERFAAMATDALRSCALEAAGYRTQILEFIESEHTPKNLLLRAVRQSSLPESSGRMQQGADEYARLKQDWGVKALATDAILQAAGQIGD